MSLPPLRTVSSSSLSISPDSQTRCVPSKASTVDMDDDFGDRPSCFSSTLQECAFVLTATSATAQTSLFGGLIVCITSRIAEDLDMSVAEVTWLSAAQSSASPFQSNISSTQASGHCSAIRLGVSIPSAISHVLSPADFYSRLAAGSFLLFFGRFADIFGRRSVLLFGMTCYSAFLLIAGFAPNAIFLDVFCGLIGLCSAASVPAAIGTLGAVYSRPSRRKNIVFACFSSGNPLGFGAGTLLSGAVDRSMSWRGSFWTLAIIYGLIAAYSWWTVPLENAHSHRVVDFATLSQLDWLGAATIISGIAFLLIGVTLAATAPHGWQTDYIVAFISFGIILVVGFVIWQGLGPNPLMPLHVWGDRNFSLLIAIISFGYAAFSSNLFFLALFLQKIQKMSPLMVAVHLLPLGIAGIVVNTVAGLLMHRVSNKLLITLGATCYVITFGLLSAMSQDSSYWAFIFPTLCLSVMGADFEFTVTNMYVMSSLPLTRQSVAGGILNTAMRLSSGLGLGVSTAVFDGVNVSDFDGEKLSSHYGKYRATFFMALACAGLSLFLVPFLTIKSQGVRSQQERE